MIRKILLGSAVLVLIIASVLIASVKYNERLEPPELVTNFVDLNIVKQITKYRSCAGHATIPQDGRELKRNMKHYFRLYPENKKENFVELFAPYDGHIALILDEEIWVAPEKKSWLNLFPINQWMFSVIHIKPKEGLKIGTKVKAGELIGYGTFLKYPEFDPSFDIVYGTISIPPRKIDNWSSPYGNLDSIFNHMSKEVLAEYKQKFVTPENIIISKEERDSDPCVYRDKGPYFAPKNGSGESVDLKK